MGSATDGTSFLRVQRDRDIIKMGKKMKLLVKGRQVKAAIDYLEGRITGNTFLQVMNAEYAEGRRKYGAPEWSLSNFPLTKFEGKRLAQEIAGRAGNEANRRKMEVRLLESCIRMPRRFTASDLMKDLGVQKPAALELGYHLVKKGLVSMRRLQGKGRALVEFTRMETNPEACERLMFGGT